MILVIRILWISLLLFPGSDGYQSNGRALFASRMLFRHANTDSSYARNVILYARKSSNDGITNNDNDEITTEIIKNWELEEIEEQKIEIENKLLQVKGNEDELPQYMIDLLAKFNENPNEYDAEPIPASKLPIIAIIGRPNTGKSTLVNKISGSYKDGAIVHDEPGITRDRTYRVGMWNNYNFQIVDTGGIIFDDTNDIFADQIAQQAIVALNEANAGVLVCDGKEGITPLDRQLAEWLRKNNKVPIFLAVNKCESEKSGISQAQEFWSLGLGKPYPVSGIHGTGLSDLLDDIIVDTKMSKITSVLKENCTNVAFVGRPNVGKSSLFNRMYGSSRSIVSNIAGTTRDTIDALITRDDGVEYRIIDTAGIRKKGKVEYGAEFFMVNRAFKAMRRAEVVVLMLDAIDGIVDQDRILAERIANEGRSCVIALNKWDIVPSKDDKTYLKAIDNIRSNLPSLRWAEIVLISALTGQRTDKLFDAIDRAAKQFTRRIPTNILNEVVQDATLWQAPPTIGARSGRIYYTIQTSSAPPTLVMFVNNPALFTDGYQRYLERKIRDSLDFEGTPLKIIWRGKALRDIGRAVRKGDATVNKMSTATGNVRGPLNSNTRGGKTDKK